MPRVGFLMVEDNLILGEATILHRFGDMRGGDSLAAGEVGDTARNAQYTMVATR